MKIMLDKKYDHLKVEEGKYENWKKKGYFTAGDISKKPYAIVIPPPNVTGKLHIGHAWDTALQDILIRYKKLKGFDTLWVPGMDHAGIATQAKVDKRLRDEGIDPRSMDREEWLKAAWAWKDEYAENIHKQWAKLGLSLDYSKERFTLDEGLSKAVRKVFVDLYNKGLIYRGERIINWDPVQLTALSNEEVIYKDEEGAFYHLKYYIDGTDEYLDVATTRPETLFGDTAVAVNPNDKRYKHLVGQNVILPIVGKKIPIIADEHADIDKGTGCVKITPAHDPNDFEVGQRHGLEKVVIMNPDATMNEKTGKYQGLNRFECREKLVQDLKEKGLLLGIEKITHSVGHSERSDAIVEPYLSKQWFVKMDVLAKNALKNQYNQNTKVNFFPERFEKTLNHWLEISHDWCISRQLWWGHRIPAWYKGDEVYVGMEDPKEEGWTRDPDTLDTWFSSALWPFSTMGWPDDTDLYKRYYPNDVIIAGFDIIFFWVSRMIFQGLEFTGQRPFKDCLIHGLVRDSQGRKMSKSLGNGVDPIDIINKYGVDSLRYFLATAASPGFDVRYSEEKIQNASNYLNKIWNSARYILLNLPDDFTSFPIVKKDLNEIDKYIINKLEETIKKVTKAMDKFDYGIASSTLYNFVYNDFCSFYLEMSKVSLSSNDNNKEKTLNVLLFTLKAVIMMIYPFSPFISEEIYLHLPGHKDSIMLECYPVFENKLISKNVNEKVEVLKQIIETVRNYKATNNFAPNLKVNLIINSTYDLTTLKDYIARFCFADEIRFNSNEVNNCFSFELNKTTLFIQSNVNKDEILAKLNEQKEHLENEIKRSENLLNNPNFINKAKKEKIDLEKEKYANYKSQYEEIIKKMKNL